MTIVTAIWQRTSSPSSYRGACCTPSISPTCGRLIQSDPANPLTYGSGVIKVQNGQQFSIKPGSYSVLLYGTDAQSNRYAGRGSFLGQRGDH